MIVTEPVSLVELLMFSSEALVLLESPQAENIIAVLQMINGNLIDFMANTPFRIKILLGSLLMK